MDSAGREAQFLQGIVVGRDKVPSHDAKTHLLKETSDVVGLVVAGLPRTRHWVAEWGLNDVRQAEDAIHIPLQAPGQYLVRAT